jgi:hypothetical protein
MPYTNPDKLAKFIGRATPDLKVSPKACQFICDKIDLVIECGMGKNRLANLKEIIQRTLKHTSPDIQIHCLNGIKNYLHSIDFQVPRKYQAKQKWLIFTEISETDLLKPIYDLLDEMILQNQEKCKLQKNKPVKKKSNLLTFLTSTAAQVSCKVLALLLVAEKFTLAKSSPVENQSIEDFVQAQQTIRILAVKVGGYGHLAATQTVMGKLRNELGFQGTFEVIHPKMDTQAVNLLFNDEPEDRTQFVTIEEHILRTRQQKVEPLTLGMSGSGDDNESPCKWITLKMGQNETALCQNVADLLNVAVYASVTHHPYLRMYMFQSGDLIYLPKQDKRYVVTQPDTFFTAPQASFSRAKKLIASDDYLKASKPALDSFVKGMEDGTFDVMPVYGKTLKDEQNGFDYLANMFQVIAGIRHAQLQKQSECETIKPVVIAVYHSYENELSEIQKILNGKFTEVLKAQIQRQINNIDNNELRILPSGAYKIDWIKNVEAAIKKLGLQQPTIFQTASISASETTRILETSTPHILLLSMGSFSKPIFDALFAHSGNNMLPPIREGYGTLSNLLLTGRPHFMCSGGGWDMGYKHMNSRAGSKLMKFYKVFCQGGNSWKNNPEFYKEFGNLINEARSPDSDLSQYFAALRNAASNRQNDRVYYMLAKSMQFLRGDPIAFTGAQKSPFPPAPYRDRDDEISNQPR